MEQSKIERVGAGTIQMYPLRYLSAILPPFIRCWTMSAILPEVNCTLWISLSMGIFY